MAEIKNILTVLSRIPLKEQAVDIEALADRWQIFSKAHGGGVTGGIYQISPTGQITRLLTSADLSTLQAFDFDLGIIAALTPVSGKFLVGRSSAWTNDFILAGDIPDISATYQPHDNDLDALAGLTYAANKLPYFTAVHTAALADFTAFARTLIDDADAAAARTTLGVTIGSDVQAYDDDLAALAALSTTGFAKRTGANTWTLNNLASTDLSDFTEATQDAIASVLTNGANITITYSDPGNTITIDVTGQIPITNGGTGAATASTARTALGLAIGTDVQAQDAELAALAALTSAANKLPYFTGSGTAALTDLSAFARTFIDDADAATVQTTLGLVPGTNVQAYDAELAALAGLVSAANKVPYFTGSGIAALADFSAFARTLVDDADATTARATLGAVIGTNVQAWDNDLDLLAALTGGGIPKRTSTNTWSLIGGELYFAASGMYHQATTGCAPTTKWEMPTNKQNVWSLDFDASAIEYAQTIPVLMPAIWDGSTVTAKIMWTAASGSGDVIWTVDARSYADDDALDQAFGTGIDVTDTLTAVGDVDISAATAPITIAGTLAAGNMVIFRVSRKATAGGDTLAVDARLLGLKIFYGVN